MQNPNLMYCVYMESKDSQPIIKELPIPEVQSNQVLVKVEYAPINPNDIKFMKGYYPCDKTFPCVLGFEGCGTVVVTGGGISTWGLSGKKVSFYTEHQFGSFAEYCVVDSTHILELEEHAKLKESACAFVNPLTVLAMLEICKKNNVKGVIINPGASQLAKMMIKLFNNNGIKVISIVRKEEQAKSLNSELVVVQGSEDFATKLSLLIYAANAQIYFDAIGGEQSGHILKMMPAGSKLIMYAVMQDEKMSEIDGGDLRYHNKTIEGFFLSHWLSQQNVINKKLLLNKLKQLIYTDLQTQIYKDYDIHQFNKALNQYQNNMSQGKVLIRPGRQVKFDNNDNDNDNNNNNNDNNNDNDLQIEQEIIKEYEYK